MHTKVPCCFVHSCISRLLCHLISVMSFIVAVPVNYCSASPKKGSKLLMGHGLSAVDNLSRTGSVQSSCITIHISWFIQLVPAVDVDKFS